MKPWQKLGLLTFLLGCTSAVFVALEELFKVEDPMIWWIPLVFWGIGTALFMIGD